jgi:His-Xaa-Ser system protein HxsD
MRLMRLTHLTRPMHQAATNVSTTAEAEAVVSFDPTIQTLAALEAASYRLIGTATCQIERVDGRFVCHLKVQAATRTNSAMTAEALKSRVLNLVTDENLRARIAEKTEGVRNVILALAFGALAASEDEPSSPSAPS